jgi:CPA1 family monovalent cation:H+ antiporter
MQDSLLPLVLALGLLVAGLSITARQMQWPVPLVMLGAGSAISFVPGLPTVALDPDLVLLLLLPPLLYSSGVGMSWPGFRSELTSILLLAVGCVLFTASAVAAVVHFALGLSWPAGFVLGAIVSPPDAVAPMAIARRLGLPHRLALIIEGESLVNDATALVVFSIALGAVATGSFSFADAALRFIAVSIGELAYGIGLGWLMLWLRNKAADPQTELLLALATPFIAFWLPHELGGSGVIAAVAAGLYVSWNGPRLIRPATRLQGFFIWGLLVWSIEALVFLLTGLQAHRIAHALTDGSALRLLAAGFIVSLTVIIVRFLWVFPATYTQHYWNCSGRDPMDWRPPFFISFAGLRGVVTLAAALSIPVIVGNGPFHDRDLILFASFCVIVATLAGLGAALPWLIERLGLSYTGHAERIQDNHNEQVARMSGVSAALAEIDRAAADGISPEVIVSLRRRHSDRLENLTATADESNDDNPIIEVSALEFRVVAAERAAINAAHKGGRLTDEARRRIERELDLEQARVEHQLQSSRVEDPSDPDQVDDPIVAVPSRAAQG